MCNVPGINGNIASHVVLQMKPGMLGDFLGANNGAWEEVLLCSTLNASRLSPSP
jgi:hypothetical protein